MRVSRALTRFLLFAALLSTGSSGLAAEKSDWSARLAACWNYILRATTGTTYAAFGEEDWRKAYDAAKAENDAARGSFALLQLVLIKASDLKLSWETRSSLSRYLHYKNRPEAIRADRHGRPAGKAQTGLVGSLLVLDELFRKEDALGERVPVSTRLGRVASTLLVDLLWAHGPFFWRNAFEMRSDPMASFWAAQSIPDPDQLSRAVEVGNWATILGLDNDPFFRECLLGTRSGLDGPKVKPGLWRRFAAFLRPALMAYFLVSYQLHGGVWLGETFIAPDTQRARPVDTESVPVVSMTQAWTEQGGFDPKGKKITFLVEEGMWNDFFRDEGTLEACLRTDVSPMRRHLSKWKASGTRQSWSRP